MDRDRPLREHLEDLRKRIMYSLLSLLVGTALSFAFHRQALEFLLAPAQGLASVPTGKPIVTEMTEYIGIVTKLSLMGGLALSLPVILWQLVLFVAPGLKPKERRYLFILLPAALLSFAGGVAFGYYVLLPPAIRFLLSWGSDIVTPMIRIGNYINLIITLLFWIGVAFETPLVMFFLCKIGVASPAFFARQRRLAIVGAFVVSAVITPTFDPINQTIVALPIIVLYELGILLSRLFGGKKAQESRPARASRPQGAK